MTFSRFASRRLLLALGVTLLTTGSTLAGKPAKPTPPPPPPPVAPAFRYQLMMLGSLGSGWSTAMDVNNLGDVVGFTADSSNRARGFVQFAGESQMTDVNSIIAPELVDLQRQNGWEITHVGAINDAAQIVAYGRLWANGAVAHRSLVLLIPDLEAENWTILTIIQDYPYALDFQEHVKINQQGDVVALGGLGAPNSGASFVWTLEDGVLDLGKLNGRLSYVQGLSGRDAGGRIQIVGKTFDGNPELGWRTELVVGSGSVAPLQSLGYRYQDKNTPGGSNALAINNFGEIAGATTVAKNDSFPARYVNGTWSSLGTLNPTVTNHGWNDGLAKAINNQGYVVGVSAVGTSSSMPNSRPFIYHDDFKIWSLDSLIDGLPTNLQGNLDTYRISDANVVCGTARAGVNLAFLLVPYFP